MNSLLLAPKDPGSSERENLSTSALLGTYLLSSFLLLIGLAGIGLLIASILNEPEIQLALGWLPLEADQAPPSLVLAFLDSFGLVVPILAIGLGLVFIVLGLRLRRRDLSSARWAQIALIWLAVALILVMVLNVIREVQQIFSASGFNLSDAQFTGIAIPGLLLVIVLVALQWLARHLHLYQGTEQLRDDTTRLAWSLLIPALAVVIFVAARPLEQTFIRSLTDKRFASPDVPSFVGLQNYRVLFNIRFDVVECRREAPDAACSVRNNGAIRWESIDTELLREGYRTAWNLHLPILWGSDRSLAISGMDADFLRGIGTTLVFTVVSVSIELVIALFMALTVNSSFAGRGIMRAIMLIPWAIPTVISARLWELMLKDTSAGIVNRVMLDFEIIQQPQAWLSDPNLQLPAAIMVDVWKTSPFMALLLLAGLQLIPSDLYEAADVDGASKLRQLFSITLPLLRPTIVVALVFRTLDALRVFDLFNVLFGRQQLTMATYNFEMLVNNQQDGYASAISVVIFFLIFAFAMLYVRFLRVETN